MKVLMTLLVRDEIDVIASNIDWHLKWGVDFFVVIDNGSVDGTRDLLDEYQRLGVLVVHDEPGRDHDQSAWVTRAALEARDIHGADWIINNDADEFWLCEGQSYRDMLRSVDDSVGVLRCPRHNMFCAVEALPETRDSGPPTYLTYRVSKPCPIPYLESIYSDHLEYPYFYFDLPPKAIVRGDGLREVHQGNHGAVHDGAVRNFGDRINIKHYPIRSRSQFEKKITQGGLAYEKNKKQSERSGWHWRRWYRMYMQNGLDIPLRDAIPTQQELIRHTASGVLIFEPDVTVT